VFLGRGFDRTLALLFRRISENGPSTSFGFPLSEAQFKTLILKELEVDISVTAYFSNIEP
jgi:hypothetical protein